MKLFSIIFAALVLAFKPISVFAQTVPQEQAMPASPVRIGITGGYGLNWQTANFLNNDVLGLFRFPEREGKFPSSFREGRGSGLFAGLVATVPLDEVWAISLRAAATQHNSLLSTREVYPTRTGVNNAVDTASSSLHSLSMQLPSVGLEALVERRLEGIGLVLQAGFRAAYIISPSFTYKERFQTSLQAAQGVFVQENSIERVPLGTNPIAIPQFAPLQVHLVGGIGYEFSLGEKLRLRPEVAYTFALTNAFQSQPRLADELNHWGLHQIRGGITLSLPLPQAIPPPVPQPNTDTAKSAPILAVRAFGLESKTDDSSQNLSQNSLQDLESERLTLRIQETISRSVFPLLPYVFFDGVGSVTLPERYALLSPKETSAFQESKLNAGYNLAPQEHSYYHILNIIGARLQRLPKATLTIHGCTDGITSERDKIGVAKARAQAVAGYLKTVWAIEPERLKLQDVPLLPNTPSVPLHDAEKQVENRRAEMRTDTPALLEHITLLDTLRRVSPPSVRFRLSAKNFKENADSLRAWKLTIRQAGRVLREFSGAGSLPSVVDWRLDERELSLLRLDAADASKDGIGKYAAALEYSLSAQRASGGEIASALESIPLETRVDNTVASRTGTGLGSKNRRQVSGNLIERFNLILFDFAKSAITSAQEPMMNLMKSRINPRSTVRVDGFTDRTGDAEFNQKLSLQRAQGVAQALGFTPEMIRTNVMGYGSNVELYDNNLPEGRFYSRTVRVVVETSQGE